MPHAQLQSLGGRLALGVGQLQHGMPFCQLTALHFHFPGVAVVTLWEACKLTAAFQICDDGWARACQACDCIKVLDKNSLVDFWGSCRHGYLL